MIEYHYLDTREGYEYPLVDMPSLGTHHSSEHRTTQFEPVYIVNQLVSSNPRNSAVERQ